jgi:hypothetical protein
MGMTATVSSVAQGDDRIYSNIQGRKVHIQVMSEMMEFKVED